MNKDALIRKLGEALVLSHTYNLRNSNKISEGLAEYQQYLGTQELSAAEMLVHAYERGESRGGSTDWDDINRAYQKACEEIGPDRVKEIAMVYAEDEEEFEDDEPDDSTVSPNGPSDSTFNEGYR